MFSGEFCGKASLAVVFAADVYAARFVINDKYSLLREDLSVEYYFVYI